MKAREDMHEHTQNLLQRLDEQFPEADKPFGFLTPPKDEISTFERTDEPVEKPEAEPLAEPVPSEGPAPVESDAPPIWFDTLNSSLQEARESQDRRSEELKREISELKSRPIVQQQPAQPQQLNYDPMALASLGDLAQMNQEIAQQFRGLQHQQWQFGMRTEYDRAQKAYEQAKTKFGAGFEKQFPKDHVEKLWHQYTANDPRRSAGVNWEEELATAYKARSHDELQTKVSSLEKEIEKLKAPAAPAVSGKPKREEAESKKNLTLVPRPGGSKGTIDSPTAPDNPLFKKSGGFKEYGRSLMRSRGA